MANVFHNAIKTGLSVLGAVAGVQVTYTRGVTTATLTATKAGKPRKVDTQDVFGLIVHPEDWIISVAGLRSAGLFPPAPGDELNWISGTTVDATYRVCQPEHETDCWRYSDPGRNYVRIHSVLDRET